MCGIAGYIIKDFDASLTRYLQEAVTSLSKRGPDLQRIEVLSPKVAFGHARLSIIDTSLAGSQPMSDASRKYTIIFNGEIFNFRALRERYLSGVKFYSDSDTEVLLHLFIRLGKDCLQHLNGFFAFAIFNSETNEIFLARDRFGIKPLHIYSDERMVVFASELKAIFQFPVSRQIDFSSLALYLQLNYVPGNYSMLRNVQKLAPGHYATINPGGIIAIQPYYSVPYVPGNRIDEHKGDYNSAKSTLRKLVEDSVQRRLVSDVPLGAFLSGGVDSSIITACAARYVKDLNTFSIGYKDSPYFDETKYANMVAKKFKTNHTVFSISESDMFENISSILEYTDEPFADSSAIAVYILSKKTRERVTVALSGDGGDELFAGYNKYRAELGARNEGAVNLVLKSLGPLFKLLPKSRHSKTTNLFRQLDRYSEGLHLSNAERYWRWCSLNTQGEAIGLVKDETRINLAELEKRRISFLAMVKDNGDLNDTLFADTRLVLPGDMLTKVDLMSMANGLEVRVPLLDFTVVDYAFSLPVQFKISGNETKKILKDAFSDVLPAEIVNRPKRGFEVPLLKWLRTGLRPLIETELLEKNFITDQNIFEYSEIEKLKQKLFSHNPGDVHATVWGLLVFQYWFKKYFAAHA